MTSSSFSYSVERALDPERPCMVEATVEFSGRNPDIAKLCAFGAQPGRRSGLRTWITQPELRWLSQHANIEISGVLYASAVKPLPPRAALPEMLTSDPLYQLSVSAGLVAEAHWHTLVEQVYKPSAEDKKETSLWATWLRAADRTYSFELALAAHNKGFFVLGYGNGSVVVNCQRPQLTDLLDFAMENNIAHPAFRTLFEEHGLIEVEA